MSLIYQSYISFQTSMYTWRSAAATAAAPVHMETTTTSTSTPPETAMMEEDPVIHDLCVHFQEAMIITAKSVDQELDALCHSFCSMTLKDKNQAQPEDDDQQQQHNHDDEPSNQVFNHVATSATAAIMTTTTSATMELDDPMMEALCVQMQSLSIHHVFKPIQKKRSSAVYDDEDNNNVCPIPTKRQRLY